MVLQFLVDEPTPLVENSLRMKSIIISSKCLPTYLEDQLWGEKQSSVIHKAKNNICTLMKIEPPLGKRKLKLLFVDNIWELSRHCMLMHSVHKLVAAVLSKKKLANYFICI